MICETFWWHLLCAVPKHFHIQFHCAVLYLGEKAKVLSSPDIVWIYKKGDKLVGTNQYGYVEVPVHIPINSVSLGTHPACSNTMWITKQLT